MYQWCIKLHTISKLLDTFFVVCVFCHQRANTEKNLSTFTTKCRESPYLQWLSNLLSAHVCARCLKTKVKFSTKHEKQTGHSLVKDNFLLMCAKLPNSLAPLLTTTDKVPNAYRLEFRSSPSSQSLRQRDQGSLEHQSVSHGAGALPGHFAPKPKDCRPFATTVSSRLDTIRNTTIPQHTYTHTHNKHMSRIFVWLKLFFFFLNGFLLKGGAVP